MKVSRVSNEPRALGVLVRRRDHASPGSLVVEQLLIRTQEFLRGEGSTTIDQAWCGFWQSAFPQPVATPSHDLYRARRSWPSRRAQARFLKNDGRRVFLPNAM